MRLYATPGTASLAPQIILREAGLTYETVRLGVREKTLPDGRPFTSISPKGYVPALELDDGSILTEGPAILLYLASKAGGYLTGALIPVSGGVATADG